MEGRLSSLLAINVMTLFWGFTRIPRCRGFYYQACQFQRCSRLLRVPVGAVAANCFGGGVSQPSGFDPLITPASRNFALPAARSPRGGLDTPGFPPSEHRQWRNQLYFGPIPSLSLQNSEPAH
jgi:hypothetical protein